MQCVCVILPSRDLRPETSKLHASMHDRHGEFPQWFVGSVLKQISCMTDAWQSSAGRRHVCSAASATAAACIDRAMHDKDVCAAATAAAAAAACIDRAVHERAMHDKDVRAAATAAAAAAEERGAASPGRVRFSQAGEAPPQQHAPPHPAAPASMSRRASSLLFAYKGERPTRHSASTSAHYARAPGASLSRSTASAMMQQSGHSMRGTSTLQRTPGMFCTRTVVCSVLRHNDVTQTCLDERIPLRYPKNRSSGQCTRKFFSLVDPDRHDTFCI